MVGTWRSNFRFIRSGRNEIDEETREIHIALRNERIYGETRVFLMVKSHDSANNGKSAQKRWKQRIVMTGAIHSRRKSSWRWIHMNHGIKLQYWSKVSKLFLVSQSRKLIRFRLGKRNDGTTHSFRIWDENYSNLWEEKNPINEPRCSCGNSHSCPTVCCMKRNLAPAVKSSRLIDRTTFNFACSSVMVILSW